VIEGRHEVGSDLSRFLFGYGIGRILFASLKDVFQRAAVLGRASITNTSLLRTPELPLGRRPRGSLSARLIATENVQAGQIAFSCYPAEAVLSAKSAIHSIKLEERFRPTFRTNIEAADQS
jgi:hypothetical protein